MSKKSMLKTPQVFQLAKALADIPMGIEWESWDAFVKEMSEEVGFPVSKANIVNAAKGAGIELPHIQSARTPPHWAELKKVQQRVADLERIVEQLSAKVFE